MLFIFRKLRRSFFLPGKVRSYVAYAIGEVVLIVLGIMIALQLGEWSQQQRDKSEEREILQRISEELQEGIEDFAKDIKSTKVKKEALVRVSKAFEGEPIMNQRAFLQDVLYGMVFGYREKMRPRSVYTELVNSGKFGLIKNPMLSKEIHDFYNDLTQTHSLHSQKVNDYPPIAFALIPLKDGGYNSVEEMNPDQTDPLVKAVLESELKNYVMAEHNRAKVLNLSFHDQSLMATQLKQLIQAELNK